MRCPVLTTMLCLQALCRRVQRMKMRCLFRESSSAHAKNAHRCCDSGRSHIQGARMWQRCVYSAFWAEAFHEAMAFALYPVISGSIVGGLRSRRDCRGKVQLPYCFRWLLPTRIRRHRRIGDSARLPNPMLLKNMLRRIPMLSPSPRHGLPSMASESHSMSPTSMSWRIPRLSLWLSVSDAPGPAYPSTRSISCRGRGQSWTTASMGRVDGSRRSGRALWDCVPLFMPRVRASFFREILRVS